MKIKIKQEPNIGDIRLVTGFAFMPKIISPKIKVWLEEYIIQEMYCRDSAMNGYYTDWYLYEPISRKIYKDNSWEMPLHLIKRPDPPRPGEV